MGECSVCVCPKKSIVYSRDYCSSPHNYSEYNGSYHHLGSPASFSRAVSRVWQVALQYLVWHLTQRGASWASGAAQAAQFVRIILLWRGL